jgi:hypothetical protein
MPRSAGVVLLLLALGGVLVAGPLRSEDDEPASLGEAFSEVGHGVRNVTRETGHAFRDAARDAKEATSDEREQVAKETGGVLQSLADALDDLAESIASWSEGESAAD